MIVTLLAGAILIAASGASPLQVYGVLFHEALIEPSGLAQVTYKATTLIFTGLAASFAFRAGLFNIGADVIGMSAYLQQRLPLVRNEPAASPYA